MRLPSVYSVITPELQRKHSRTARFLGIIAATIYAASAYLPWAYGREALDNMSYLGGPSPLQFMGLGLAVVHIIALTGSWFASRIARVRGATKLLHRFAWNKAAHAGAWGMFIYILVIIIAISVELGGVVNVEYGAWIALAAAAIAVVGSWFLPFNTKHSLYKVPPVPILEILTITALLAGALLAVAYALNQQDGGVFVVLITHFAVMIVTTIRSGVGEWLRIASQRHRNVLVFAAFVTAYVFPFTQNGSDQNMSIATEVLTFAATAIGLNIVVGLAGLLDLGYIAFLGAGAFTGAVLSESAFATFIGWKPPFIVTMLIAGLIAAILGLIIGSPTLRVSGDYLAIVTLAFGEIFQISMSNLDGTSGPDVVRGANGIPAIPDLNLFGFDFGQPHVILGVPLGRFSNYFFLLLLLMAFIILVFTRLNQSRIGRGWVAIREDEKAAEAMGVNVFGLKLLAFAGGAFLAGLAGAVKAHVDVSVTPAQYIFLESAFLLAAVVLGGMGTVLGVIVGATLLKLMPEKLRFVAEYRMLFFGALMVLMMRFRPEGLIASQRRQLEFHEDDEELAEEVDSELPYEFAEGKSA
ncbi:MAG TPA: branched-chain amino acid ABC transporter permease [Propionibacteriaceae bacterium]|nr:branched-chain amino acid ABC transporter permease [Propionibacteriaceae bacterium]